MSSPQAPSTKGMFHGQLSKTQSCQVCGKPRLHSHSIWDRLCLDCSAAQKASKSYANSVMPEKQHLKVQHGPQLNNSGQYLDNSQSPIYHPKLEQPSGRAGVKDDQGKARWDLLPWKAMAGLVAVLTFGAKKYSPNGWRTVPNAKDRYTSAMMRHMYALSVGEDVDKESGLRHIDHVLTNVAFLAELMED
jgi:hypothetical protein